MENISKEEFILGMNARLAHYKSGATTNYSNRKSTIKSKIESNPILTKLHKITSDSKEKGRSLLMLAQEKGDNGIALLQGLQNNGASLDKATEDFRNQMKKSKEEINKDFEKKLDEIFEELINYGVDNPNEREQVLETTDLIGDAFLVLGENFSDLFSNVASKVVGFFKNTGEWFSKSATTVADWGTGAWNSFKSFF